MIIVLCRAKPSERSWLIFGEEESTLPLCWAAPPDVDQAFCARLGRELAGCFEAQWTERNGEMVLMLGRRLPLPADGSEEDRRALG